VVGVAAGVGAAAEEAEEEEEEKKKKKRFNVYIILFPI
jgi:hypothetical protein